MHYSYSFIYHPSLLRMHHIIYLSWATISFTNAQLDRLLTGARRRNTELAVTGILFYGNGRFLQVLEGEEEIVQEIYAHIKRDPRHGNILTFANKPIAERAFKEWAMAFQPLASQQFEDIVAYLGPPDVPVNTAGLSDTDRHLFDLLRAFVLP
ncbi:MAG: BLUF domain-containing protein [Hymenobacter sp.]|nr:MAG: BLUF domain-containing protein [Hymenobacter sp.]